MQTTTIPRQYMNLCIRVFTILVILLHGERGQCQKTVVNSNQQWLQYYNSLKLSDSWSIYTDVGVRTRNDIQEISQMLIRAGLGKRLNDQTRIIAGFAFLSFHKQGETTKVEYRPYQELNLVQILGKGKIQHRFRAEQRFFSFADESGIESNFNHRFRYRILYTIPLFHFTNENKLVSLNLGDEILINAGKEISYNMFDGNRLMMGSSIQINPTLNISLTYNFLFSQLNTPENFRKTHVLWVGIKHKIDVAD